MTNSEIKKLHEALALCGNLKGVNFGYAISKNYKATSSAMEIIQKEITKIQELHCEKDEKGKPIIENNQYKIIDLPLFQKDYNQLMEIETEINLHKVNLSEIPEEITVGQLDGIISMIEDE